MLGDVQPLKREFDLHRAMWIGSLGKAHNSFKGFAGFQGVFGDLTAFVVWGN